jgi:hypothetical protein
MYQVDSVSPHPKKLKKNYLLHKWNSLVLVYIHIIDIICINRLYNKIIKSILSFKETGNSIKFAVDVCKWAELQSELKLFFNQLSFSREKD